MNSETTLSVHRIPRASLSGPFVWDGQALSRRGDWIYELTARDIDEIDGALDHASNAAASWRTLRRENFPVPRLSSRLRQVAQGLEHGHGIALIRGFPVTRYTDEQVRLAFTGFGLHLGVPVYQNARGERLREIRDEGADRGRRYGQIRSSGGEFLSSRARVASTGELRFHTDRTDLVALLCVQPAKAGGVSRIASSVAVHNAMLKRRPDLLECLYGPYPRSRFGEEAQSNDSFYMLPVMGLREDFFTSHYSRTYIEAAQLIETAPRLSDTQWEAINLLAELSAELCLSMQLETGDLQILNSHVTYHARSAYEDEDETARQRMLYRLWLCPPGNRPLPEDHAVLWGATGAGTLRGGIGQQA